MKEKMKENQKKTVLSQEIEGQLSKAFADVDTNFEKYVDGVCRLIRHPSISSLGQGLPECAQALAEMMQASGIEDVKVVETKGAPLVLGSIDAQGPGAAEAPTLLVYGHYDVQPPEPLEAWDSPPFEPDIRDGRIYGRGTGDNKGQLLAHVFAVESLKRTCGHVPVNIKFLFEGEEESGSGALLDFISENKEALAADLAFYSDGPMMENGQAAVVFGARGVLGMEIVLRGANRDVHSGNMGGPVPNPGWDLVQLLTSMKGPDGWVKVEGFYDNILSPSGLELAALEGIAFDADEFKRTYGIKKFAPGPGESFHEKLMFWPTMNIQGMVGGYTGKGMKTVTPAEMRVKMDMRLVANQDPEDILEKVTGHIMSINPNAEIIVRHGTPPSKTPLDHPMAPAMIEATRIGFEEEPVVVPCSGGTAPDYMFTSLLEIPLIIVPYANPDEDNHAPNENLRLDCLRAGIRTSIAAFLMLGSGANRE